MWQWSYSYSFFVSTLDGGEWSALFLCCFTLGERAPHTHRRGGCVDLRVGMDGVDTRKNSTAENRTRAFQPLARRSTEIIRLPLPIITTTVTRKLQHISTSQITPLLPQALSRPILHSLCN
jgi:hypothetical protein